MKSLATIQGWKQFERLCADLLQAEGFHVDSEPSVDTTGADIVALCDYRSHSSGIPPVRVRWRVQCKHLAQSGTHLTRPEVESVLVSFDAVRGADDGLLLIVSSDYTEPAKVVVQKFIEQRPGVKVMIWNERQLMALLDRHGHVLQRYGLASPPPERPLPQPVPRLEASGPVLFVSDQSALAHECAAYLRSAGLETVFLPHWNYSDTGRLRLFTETFRDTVFGLCVCFMGDSFGLPFPEQLETTVIQAARQGTPLLLFPFVAWLVQHGALGRLSHFVPVRLRPSRRTNQAFSRTKLFADRRPGDFRWLLAEASFEEDEYREYDPADGHEELTRGVTQPIGFPHSFEHLEPVDGAIVVWADTIGNPLLVLGDFDGTKVAYFNSCCHSCLTHVPIPSPLHASVGFGTLMTNALRWLIDKKAPLPTAGVTA